MSGAPRRPAVTLDRALAPAVSVIVRTYQRRERVGRAVTRVLAQTYKDLERIVIEDGPMESTGEAQAGAGITRARCCARGLAGAQVWRLDSGREPASTFGALEQLLR